MDGPSLAALVRAQVCVLDGRDPVLAEDVLPGAVEEQQGDGERPVRDGRAVQRRPTLPVHALDGGSETCREFRHISQGRLPQA